MDKTKLIHNLLDGTATEEEVAQLKQGLVNGEISIGGNVFQSIIVIGSGNTVQIPSEALERIGGRSLLGNLERDLTDQEIFLGLERLESELPLRAPILLPRFNEQANHLRSIFNINKDVHSDHVSQERIEPLAVINSLCIEVLDISFNALCLGDEPLEYDLRPPFRGLESFRPEDCEFFFGRDELIEKLVAKIHAHSFLAVIGASGSGKSSLVMAGLIPALNSEYFIFRPGTNPLKTLKSAPKNALVVVDQFEELFTLTNDKALQKQFIAKLLHATKRQKVIVTMRSDFLGEVARYRILNEEVQNHLENVSPMEADELLQAMEAQASQVGLRFEADLSQQILDGVEGEPGAMPLLQHALWTLWTRRHGCWLRAEEYRAFGGVKQAITSTAEAVYAHCSDLEREHLHNIFLRLTRLDAGSDGRDTRRRMKLNDLIPADSEPDITKLLIKQLADARLVVVTGDEVEVAHEALVRHWERLRTWLNSDRENLLLMESVNYASLYWKNAAHDKALLNHRGPRLEQALELKQSPFYHFTSVELSYLDACSKVYEKERRDDLLHAQSQLLIELSNSIAQVGLGEQEIFDLVHEKTTDVIDTDNMYIALYDETSDIVRFGLVYIDGEKQDIEFDQRWQPRKAGHGKTETIIKTRKRIFHATGEESEEWYAQNGVEYIGMATGSWMGVPISVEDRVLGVLSIYHPDQDNAYNIDDLDFLQSVANLTASALENSNLFYKTNQSLDVIREFGMTITAAVRLGESELLALIYKNLSRIMATDNMYIALYDELSDIIRFGLAYIDGKEQNIEFDQTWQPRKAGNGKTDEIIRTRKPIFHVTQKEAEAWYMQPGRQKYVGSVVPSWMGVPIVFGDTVLGVIGAYALQEYMYTNDDFFILSMFADQVASPLYNIKLFDEFGYFAEQMETLISIGQSLVSVPHLSKKEILNTIYTNISQYMNIKNIFIASWNNKDNQFEISWHEDNLTKNNEVIKNSCFSDIISTKQPLFFSMEDEFRQYLNAQYDKNTEDKNTNWASVPMIVKGKMTGVIGIIQEEGNNNRSRNDLMFLEGISHLVSSVFENV